MSLVEDNEAIREMRKRAEEMRGKPQEMLLDDISRLETAITLSGGPDKSRSERWKVIALEREQAIWRGLGEKVKGASFHSSRFALGAVPKVRKGDSGSGGPPKSGHGGDEDGMPMSH